MAPPRTYIFFGLNVVRILSIISLLLVFSSSIFDIVTNVRAVNAFVANRGDTTSNTTINSTSNAITNTVYAADLTPSCDYIEGSSVPNQPAGAFWAVVSTLLVIFQTIILLFSELGWPASFFERFFPVLGPNFGLGALGIFQCLIGAQILSHHVDNFTLVSAFFLFSLGCLNMLLGLIFRESAKKKRSIKAWRSEAKGVLPISDNRPIFVNASPPFVPALFHGDEKGREAAEFGTWRSDSLKSDKSGYGFGRQGEKAAGMRGFTLQRPEESLPRYASPPASTQPRHSVRTSTSSFSSPEIYRETIHSSSSPPSRPHSPVSSRPERKAPMFKSSSTVL